MGEFEKLVQLLTENNIPHVVKIDENYASDLKSAPKPGWKQIFYPSDDDDKRLSDVVWHYGSYGYEEGLLEQMGLVKYYDPEYENDENDVRGWLTAEDVFECWKQHYENRKENTNE